MKLRWLALTALLLIACEKRVGPIQRSQSPNGYAIDLLFTHDGCRVYRFYDGRAVYFTDCGSAVAHDTQYCGKGCVENVDVQTIRLHGDAKP